MNGLISMDPLGIELLVISVLFVCFLSPIDREFLLGKFDFDGPKMIAIIIFKKWSNKSKF
jgi:hypothetical protein